MSRPVKSHAWIALMAFVALLAGGPAQARDMMLTIYDDGRSCPHDCDAHVVFNPADNGTRFAFSPQSSRVSPAPCEPGTECTICFGEADDSCMTSVYRGGGPAKGRFDFTPAFYDANCSRSDIPRALRKQCDALDKAATRLGYADAINCFATPDSPKCADVMTAAKAAQDADAPKRAQCLSMGEDAYNRAQPDSASRRSNGCDYSLLALGGNGRWKKLLPGACRPNTYVDPFGLDCCSASVRFAAANHPECRSFFKR